jgi:alpha-L-rhamnosidase
VLDRDQRQGRFDLNQITVGELLDDPESREIIDELVPEIASNPMISMARAMHFDVLAGMAGTVVDPKVLAELRERLRAL